MGKVYGFAKGPVYHGDPDAMFRSAFEQPASWIGSLGSAVAGGAISSVGAGVLGRKLVTPPTEAPVEPGLVIGEAETVVPDTPQMRRRMMQFGDLAIVRPETQEELQSRRREAKALDEAAWKASPFFRDDIPWDPGMTEERAASLAIQYDQRKVREHFASKRPWTSLIGGFLGQAVDPINYIPIAGPAVKAAQVARFGRVAGGAATAALDAAANTALFGALTAGERSRYGDDVSWQAQITDIAVGALIGTAFGGIAGGIEAWRGSPAGAKPNQDIINRLADLGRVQESRVALNEGIDALANGEDIALSPNAVEPLRRAAVDVRRVAAAQDGGVQGLAPQDIVSRIDRTASPEEKVRQLQQLTAENRPTVDAFLRGIDEEFGTKSNSNEKLPERIVEKAKRPSILESKPWHDIEHVRDSFRFKTVLDDVNSLPAIITRLEEAGFTIVKRDVDKVLEPLSWGWRIASFDLQMPNGQLVEYYLPVKELEAAKKAGGHQLFEKWRNRASESLTPDEQAEYKADQQRSRDLYQSAWDAFLARTGTDESAVRASLTRAAGSGTSLKPSSSSPNVNLLPGFQVPPTRVAANLVAGSTTTANVGSSRLIQASTATSVSPTSIPQIDRSAPRPDPAPEGRPEAESSVGKPEGLAELAATHGVDLATGEFDEMADIDALRALGRLTAQDEAALTAASEDFEAAEAFGNTLKAALHCVV